MVHAGLHDFENMPIEDYEEDELLFGSRDFETEHYANTSIVVDHLPTRFISKESQDKILHFKDTLPIDCWFGFGGQLRAICFETMEEIYIKK